MNYCWDEFPKSTFEETQKNATSKLDHNDFSDCSDFRGCVRVGDLCFDIVMRDSGAEHPALTYDLYAGHIDSGYGYSCRSDVEVPYDYIDGWDFDSDWVEISYDEFKNKAEKELTEFILRQSATSKYELEAKANEPLNIW